MIRGAVAGLATILGAVLVAAAPGPDSSPAGAEVREVSSVTLTCPEIAVTADSASIVGSLVAGGVSARPRGSARMQLIDADTDLARIAAPSAPVHVLVSGRSKPAVVTRAADGWAPEVVSGLASRDMGGAGAGLASTSCLPAAPEWWFVGAGSQVGRGATVLVANPGQEPARVDVRLFGRSGEIDALAGKGIDVAARGEVRLRLDALAPDEVLIAVTVQATHGRVSAALWDVAVPVDGQGRGVDFIPAAVPPATDLVIAGIPPGGGRRDLVLVNPGSHFATVTTRLLTEAGPEEIDGLATVAVPAGAVASVNLGRLLEGRGGALHLVADTPITGGVRSSWGSALRDVMWLSATPSVSPAAPLAGAAVVPAGRGLETTVSIAAPGGEVAGSLVVVRAGVRRDSVFSATGGPLGDGTLAADEAGTVELMLPGADDGVDRLAVTVPSGSQVSVTPDLSRAAVASLWWLADAGSGPAAISHLSADLDVPLATGYQWWPARSFVLTFPVRPDLGTLLGARR